MEAVGQLTGGLAHDFNNLLGGISASLQVLQARLQRGRTDDLERYIHMGQDAVRRAASLTHRLLAFSRRQTLDPKPLDVHRLVSDMQALVRSSVGPNVAVRMVDTVGLWQVRVDASQLENSLLNLCINARDAMQPAGGQLTIEASNRALDERGAREVGLPPGEYISICVTDTGTGMSPDVQARAFDPFFTTKPLGQGTGLGLSMVYGFVRQSGGQIGIESEAGHGTTMCMHLPRYAGKAVAGEAAAVSDAVAHGAGETVLIIEDEPTIRVLVTEILQESGYCVIAAEDGQTGLAILQGEGRIDLLVTDVGLPGGLNGRQVADAARVGRPDLKILFITGYAENAAVGNGQMERGMEVMTKPFEVTALASKVREMVEASR
jgi:CheY-like chemotaxis protein